MNNDECISMCWYPFLYLLCRNVTHFLCPFKTGLLVFVLSCKGWFLWHHPLICVLNANISFQTLRLSLHTFNCHFFYKHFNFYEISYVYMYIYQREIYIYIYIFYFGVEYKNLLPILSFFFAFLLFRASPMAYRCSQARSLIRATATGLCHSHSHSHSNTRSEPHLKSTPELTAMPEP